jgi:hypothetical protein
LFSAQQFHQYRAGISSSQPGGHISQASANGFEAYVCLCGNFQLAPSMEAKLTPRRMKLTQQSNPELASFFKSCQAAWTLLAGIRDAQEQLQEIERRLSHDEEAVHGILGRDRQTTPRASPAPPRKRKASAPRRRRKR